MDCSLLVHSVSVDVRPKLKRPCCSPLPDSTRLSNPNLSPLDALLESFLELSDSSEIALDISIDRILDSRQCDFDKNSVIDRALRLGSALTEAAKRAARRRASTHNGVVWALPLDLTIKVFSLLDTRSLCHAAATCSFFQKCAADPLCYSNIDLTTVVPKVNNMVVSTMIQRAGKVMRSLKLGVVPCPPIESRGSSRALVYSMRNSSDTSGVSWNDKRSRQGKESFVLTRSCLAPLIADGGATGARLRRLHLYNIETMDNTAFGAAVLACPSLIDLEIVGLHVELRQTLESVSRSCPVIERLFFESSRTVHGFRKLKYVDFSTSYSFTGIFLRSLGGSTGGNLLEILLLQDCMHLREAEVSRLLSAILTGRFSNLRHLDVSNREGLVASGDDWYRRGYTLSFMSLGELLEERPNFCLVADFPADGSFLGDPMSGSDVNSDTNSPSLTSSHTSDGYGGPSSSSESSYGSDQSSGNEENPSYSRRIYRESSDKVAY
ncbi:hypothetical protein OROHE_025858 [Orobanche hederae]